MGRTYNAGQHVVEVDVGEREVVVADDCVEFAHTRGMIHVAMIYIFTPAATTGHPPDGDLYSLRTIKVCLLVDGVVDEALTAFVRQLADEVPEGHGERFSQDSLEGAIIDAHFASR